MCIRSAVPAQALLPLAQNFLGLTSKGTVDLLASMRKTDWKIVKKAQFSLPR